MKYKKFNPDYVEFAEVDDMWVRAYTIPKSQSVISQHVHTHDHITLLSHGAVECWRDGERQGEYHAPAVIRIPAGSKHAFRSLTDDVVLCCLHNLRGTGVTSPELLTEEI
jgi:hypothetical protein